MTAGAAPRGTRRAIATRVLAPVLVSGALAIVLLGCGGDDTSVETDWRRVEPDASVFGGDLTQAMRSATAGGPGLVVVGEDTGRSAWGELAGAVWTSVDGLEWDRVTHDEMVFGGDGNQEMVSVTAGGPGLVAVGKDSAREAAAVWTSVDGLVWERVAHDEAVFGGGFLQEMLAVTAGGPGLVAVGADWDRPSAAVWTSVDGVVWERVDHDDAAFGQGGADEIMVDQWMRSVTAGGPGLVAVGGDWRRDVAAVWTSVDGSRWERVTHEESVFGGEGDQEMWSVTVGGPGLVAVGRGGRSGGAAVWTSEDGSVWQRVAHDEAVFGSSGQVVMSSVTVGGPGLVAVGVDFERDVAVVWTSIDGVVWERAAHDEAVFGGDGRQQMESVIAGGPGLVAVGEDMGRQAAAVWTMP